MMNEFLTDVQLDTVCGANQIQMIKEPPANKIPPRPKTNTERELKVPLITIVPCPYIKDNYSEQIPGRWLERLIPDMPIELTLPTAKAGGSPNSTTVAPRLRLTWSPKA